MRSFLQLLGNRWNGKAGQSVTWVISRSSQFWLCFKKKNTSAWIISLKHSDLIGVCWCLGGGVCSRLIAVGFSVQPRLCTSTVKEQSAPRIRSESDPLPIYITVKASTWAAECCTFLKAKRGGEIYVFSLNHIFITSSQIPRCIRWGFEVRYC